MMSAQHSLNQMYDALDKRNYKLAIKIANKAKRPTDILMVLKAHACQQLGKNEEALEICLNIKEKFIPEEYLINHLTMVFNNLGFPHLATETVAKACNSLKKNSPLLEKCLKQLFFAYGREKQYLSQQQTAMKLFRQYKKPEYALWTATAMLLQVNNKSGNETMLLMMSSRFLKTALETLPERGGQASELYLDVLSRQKQYKEAIDAIKTLTSASSGRLKSASMLPVEVKKLEASFYAKLNDISKEEEIAKDILTSINADDWDAYISLIDICKRYLCGNLSSLSDTNTTTTTTNNNNNDNQLKMTTASEVKDKINNIYLFIEELSNKDEHKGRLRGPLLGLISFEYELRNLNICEMDNKTVQECLNSDGVHALVDGSKLLKLIKLYVETFGSKNCCFKDLKQYFSPFVCSSNDHNNNNKKDKNVSEDVQKEFVLFLNTTINNSDALIKANISNEKNNNNQVIDNKQLKKELQKYIFSIQTLLYINYDFHDFKNNIVSTLVNQWKTTLPLNEGVSGGQREVQCGDNLLILASQVLLNQLATRNGTKVVNMNSKLIDILSILHYGMKHSMYNFHLKLLMLQIYEIVCCADDAMEIYKSLSIKYIQLDTLSYLIFNTAVNSCARSKLTDLCKNILLFHTRQDKQIYDAMQTAYTYNNAMQIFEFTKFRNTMKKSSRRLRCDLETAYSTLLYKNGTANISTSAMVVSKLYESITTMTTTTTTGNTKDSNNTNKGDNKVLLHILKDIDLDFFDNISNTEDTTILTPLNYQQDSIEFKSKMKDKNARNMKVLFLHLKMFFALFNLDLNGFDDHFKLFQNVVNNNNNNNDINNEIPHNAIVMKVFELVREILNLNEDTMNNENDQTSNNCIESILSIKNDMSIFFEKVISSTWSYENTIDMIDDMYMHPNIIKTLSHFFTKGFSMIIYLFYGIISNSSNMKSLKKQKKKKKKKKKKNNNNSNTNNNDNNIQGNVAPAKLLKPLKELIEVMNTGIVDCIDMLQKKVKKETQKVEMTNLQKTFGISNNTNDNNNNELKLTLDDDPEYKLCKEGVFQKIYESHCHTYENLLEQAVMCDANVEGLLSLMK